MKLGCFQSTWKHLVYNFVCIIAKSYGSCLYPVHHKMGGIPIVYFYSKNLPSYWFKQTNIYYGAFFFQSGSQEWLSCVILPQSLSWDCTEEFGPEFSSHLKVCLGLKDSFPRWLIQWLFTDFSSLPHGSLQRAAWASSQYGTWLSLEWSIREQGRSHDVFYDLNLEIIHYFYNILMVIQADFIHCVSGYRK